jgi:hypothetical protein
VLASAGLPEVDAAAGTILDLSGDEPGEDPRQGRQGDREQPTFGLGIDPADGGSTFKLVAGARAAGPHQVVVDLNTADEQGFKWATPSRSPATACRATTHRHRPLR